MISKMRLIAQLNSLTWEKIGGRPEAISAEFSGNIHDLQLRVKTHLKTGFNYEPLPDKKHYLIGFYESDLSKLADAGVTFPGYLERMSRRHPR